MAVVNVADNIKNAFTYFKNTIVNNLTSTSTTKCLAAAQGKVLNEKIDKLVPVGYIFLWSKYSNVGEGTAIETTNHPDLSTAQKVHDHFGFGTWSLISEKFLVGVSSSGSYFTEEDEGGSATVTLTTANLPSHSHSIPSLSGSAASAGAHTHSIQLKYDNDATTKSSGSARMNAAGGKTTGTSPAVGTALSAGAHTHNVTTNASTSGNTGSGTAINILPPYRAVYMWQRIA